MHPLLEGKIESSIIVGVSLVLVVIFKPLIKLRSRINGALWVRKGVVSCMIGIVVDIALHQRALNIRLAGKVVIA